MTQTHEDFGVGAGKKGQGKKPEGRLSTYSTRGIDISFPKTSFVQMQRKKL